jgi:hypothetical protein
VALAGSDPARAQLFQARLQALAASQIARQNAQRELTQKADQQQQEYLAQAKEKLSKPSPPGKTLKLPVARDDRAARLCGQELWRREAAARATIDPAIYKLAQKAMLYDRAQAAKTPR